MSTHTIRVPSFPVPAIPRGSRIAAALFARLWSALVTPRQAAPASAASVEAARAMRERVAEASRVRRVARRLQHADPRFAAELFAAADRHERLGE